MVNGYYFHVCCGGNSKIQMSNLRVGQICLITSNDCWVGYKGDICKILVVDYNDNTVLIQIINGRDTGAKGWIDTTSIKPISVKYYYEKV